MKKYFYHIADPQSQTLILKEGLKCNSSGQIFLLNKLEMKLHSRKGKIFIADLIALNQVFLSEYIIIKVDSKGISGELIHDNVSEAVAKHQYILNQQVIKPTFLKVIDRRKTSNSFLTSLIPNFDPNNIDVIDDQTGKVVRRIRYGKEIED